MKPFTVKVGLTISGLILGVLGAVIFIKLVATPKAAATDSPVVVRGGAMTVRTKDTTDGWVPAGAFYCTYVPLGNPLNLYLYEVDNYKNKTPIPTNPLPLTGSWTVTINGRIPKYIPPTPTSPGYWDSTTPSSNGIILQGSNSNCTAPSSTQSLVVLTTTGTYGSFYMKDLGLHEESSVDTGKRFMDTTPASGSTPSVCAGPNSNPTPTGNEDSCERALLITVTTSSGGPYYGRCTNGECIVGIGN
jgi:hypothetical protein